MAVTINEVEKYNIGGSHCVTTEFTTDNATANDIDSGLSWVEHVRLQPVDVTGESDTSYICTKNSSSASSNTEDDLGRVSFGSLNTSATYLMIAFGR